MCAALCMFYACILNWLWKTVYFKLTIEDSMSKIAVMLMNEDRTLSLTIEFWGYAQEDAEKYLVDTFIECDKPYAEKWTQLKWL